MATCKDCISCEDNDHEICDCCGKCLNCGARFAGSPAPATPVDTWPWRNPERIPKKAPVQFPSMEGYDVYEFGPYSAQPVQVIVH